MDPFDQQPPVELDRVSFEDSERFEDDSICSFQSENESLNQKWSEWNLSGSDLPGPSTSTKRRALRTGMPIPSLRDICAKKVATGLTFEEIEAIYQSLHKNTVPAPILRQIYNFCFPSNPENIKTYSFITNGSTQPFDSGHHLFINNAVFNVFQIGYHISAYVSDVDSEVMKYQEKDGKGCYKVSVQVDRCRIISCSCSCSSTATWCKHIIAVCLYRIMNAEKIQYRSPIWDSIAVLGDLRVKKFAQYLINESPAEFIVIAQRLLDQLAVENSEINQTMGAPDPTAGGDSDYSNWFLDEKQLHESIRKILISFVKPGPMVWYVYSVIHLE
uniref:SWIM-type domain-containing protein n=2 Tax=Bursaphelenchus xylophilus TaxID=6326 RepID=A0A1I7RHN5_BURXY